MRTERRPGSIRSLAASMATVVSLGLPVASVEAGASTAMAASTPVASECVIQVPYDSLQKPILLFQSKASTVATNPNRVAKFGEVRQTVTDLTNTVLHEVFNKNIGPKGNGAIKSVPGENDKWNPHKLKSYTIDLTAHFQSAPAFQTQNGNQTVCEQPTVGEISFKIPGNLDKAYLQLVKSRHKTAEKIMALAKKIPGIYLSYFDRMNSQHTEDINRGNHGWKLEVNGNLSAATNMRASGLGYVPFTEQRLLNAKVIGKMLTGNLREHEANAWSSVPS